MKIQHNAMAVTAVNELAVQQNKASKSVMHSSAGKNMHSAADEPAGMIIAHNQKPHIRRLDTALRVGNSGQDAANNYDGKFRERQDLLKRMREISVQVSGNTLTLGQKNLATKEFDGLLKEFSNSTVKETGMEIVALNLEGDAESLYYTKNNRVFAGEEWVGLQARIPEASRANNNPVSLVDYHTANSQRSSFGAASSLVESQLSSLSAGESNVIKALVRIEDMDYAKEILGYCRESLVQVETFVSAQANAHPQNVLQLFEPASAAALMR